MGVFFFSKRAKETQHTPSHTHPQKTKNKNMGKVHGSLARAGKVRGQVPKVEKMEKKKPKVGRAKKRIQYNRRFVNVVVGPGKKLGPNSQVLQRERRGES